MPNLLSLFSSWKACLVAVLVSSLLSAFATWRVMTWRDEAHQTQQAVKTVRLVDQGVKINMSIGDVVVQGVKIITTETTRVIREIPQHVTPEIDREYSVPLGFVRVWNDASGGPIPGPSAGSDADPSGTKFSDIAYAHTSDTDTIKTCHVYLSAWWDWYDKQAGAWNKAAKH